MSDLTQAVRKQDPSVSDVWLPEETVRIRTMAREFADDVLRPVAHEVNCTAESRDGFRHDIFREIAAAGIYRVPFGEDVGGFGLEFPVLATLTVMEELAYYSAGVASAMFDGQAILVGKTLDRAPPAIRRKWLPGIVRGEYVASFATSEPAASTDLSVKSLMTTADQVPGGWRINGRKRWITNSVAASRVLLLCRSGDTTTTFFVDMKAEGVWVGEPDRKMGNYPQLTADIVFNSVFVPEEDVVGDRGAGLRTALAALALGRMGIGAAGVGMAQRAIDVATAYTSERKVFGQPVAAFQHWQFKFADHTMSIEKARSLYQKAGMNVDRGNPAEPLAAMSKIAGSELAVDVARDAIQACGAYGFCQEIMGSGQQWPLEGIYRDAKIGEIYEGANEVQRWVIARHLLGRQITG